VNIWSRLYTFFILASEVTVMWPMKTSYYTLHGFCWTTQLINMTPELLSQYCVMFYVQPSEWRQVFALLHLQNAFSCNIRSRVVLRWLSHQHTLSSAWSAEIRNFSIVQIMASVRHSVCRELTSSACQSHHTQSAVEVPSRTSNMLTTTSQSVCHTTPAYGDLIVTILFYVY